MWYSWTNYLKSIINSYRVPALYFIEQVFLSQLDSKRYSNICGSPQGAVSGRPAPIRLSVEFGCAIEPVTSPPEYQAAQIVTLKFVMPWRIFPSSFCLLQPGSPYSQRSPEAGLPLQGGKPSCSWPCHCISFFPGLTLPYLNPWVSPASGRKLNSPFFLVIWLFLFPQQEGESWILLVTHPWGPPPRFSWKCQHVSLRAEPVHQ